MKSFKQGIVYVFSGTITGIFINALLTQLSESGLLSIWIVLLISTLLLVGSLEVVFTFEKAGPFFLLGLIIGAMLLIDMLGLVDSLLYIGAPFLALIIRGIWYIKDDI